MGCLSSHGLVCGQVTLSGRSTGTSTRRDVPRGFIIPAILGEEKLPPAKEAEVVGHEAEGAEECTVSRRCLE